MSDFISVSNIDFLILKKIAKRIFMFNNPPYGVRIGKELDKIYSLIGDTLKQKYQNTNAWIISSNFEAIKRIGLKPSKKVKIYNGKLESKFIKYEIYEGSKNKI